MSDLLKLPVYSSQISELRESSPSALVVNFHPRAAMLLV